MTSVSDYTLILIGKTGFGKSATGNTIIGAHEFLDSDSCESVTSECQVAQGENFGFHLTVIDTPGVMDTLVNSDEAKEKTCQAMIDAISKCPKSKKRALCLVLKYGERFTDENKKSLYILTRVFGAEFLAKFCVIIFTHGDSFDANNKGTKSFDEWCHEQTLEMAQLFKECSNRCVLFRNKTENDDIKKKQIEELIKHVEDLKESYTDEKFTEAKKRHQRLFLEANLTKILNMFNTKNQSLQQELDEIILNEIRREKLQDLKNKTEGVLTEIDKDDDGVFYDIGEVSLLEDPRMCTQKIIKNCDDLLHLEKLKALQLKIQSDVKLLESKCINCTPSKCSIESMENLEQEMKELFGKYNKYGFDFCRGDLIEFQPHIDKDIGELRLSEKELSFFNDEIEKFNRLANALCRLRNGVVFENNRNEIQGKTRSLRRELDAVLSSEISTGTLTILKDEAESVLRKWEEVEDMAEILEPLREVHRRIEQKIKDCKINLKVEIISGAVSVASGAVGVVGGVAGLSKNAVAIGVSKAAPGVGKTLIAGGDVVKSLVKGGVAEKLKRNGSKKNTEE
ncbi:unnamed protein product [Lymnaea stagnalis]|uniref:AIG1-type G domain-containing protein n=1 Tax=Lymnaea stagnalis TaxID=6523 RepID=A0AAV2GXR3_LYMST